MAILSEARSHHRLSQIEAQSPRNTEEPQKSPQTTEFPCDAYYIHPSAQLEDEGVDISECNRVAGPAALVHKLQELQTGALILAERGLGKSGMLPTVFDKLADDGVWSARRPGGGFPCEHVDITGCQTL